MFALSVVGHPSPTSFSHAMAERAEETLRALVFNTGDTPPERELLVFGDPMQRIWETGVFDFCGVRTVVRRMYGPVTSSTYEQRTIWLDEVAELVKAALAYPSARAPVPLGERTCTARREDLCPPRRRQLLDATVKRRPLYAGVSSSSTIASAKSLVVTESPTGESVPST